jgi:hypothetical protein
VHCFGCYELEEKDETSYNIVLDFGRKDLVELYYSESPPCESHRINESWEMVFDLAKALDTIHNFSYSQMGQDIR